MNDTAVVIALALVWTVACFASGFAAGMTWHRFKVAPELEAAAHRVVQDLR
jgi:hypothetical protein